jgi:hypothetical protein
VASLESGRPLESSNKLLAVLSGDRFLEEENKIQYYYLLFKYLSFKEQFVLKNNAKNWNQLHSMFVR